MMRKDEIIMNLKDYNAGRRVVTGGTHAFEAKLAELEHVYAQAAEYKEYRADTEKLYNALKAKGEKEILKYKTKADEYEAKAKAFDLLKNRLEKEVKSLINKVSGFPYVDAPIENTISHYEHVLEMMEKYENTSNRRV